MEIIARFSHEKIDHTKSNTPNLVLSLTAPNLDWVKKRPSLCVIAVIDVSGSMGDDSKLVYAKKSLHKLVDQLQPGDISGLIAFGSRVDISVKPQTVTAEFKTKFHSAIDKLVAHGGTDLHGGIQTALREVEALDVGPQYLKRVIIFTDGEPSSGIVDKDVILKQLEENLGTATVSAFGYGEVTTKLNVHGLRGCDPEFMTKISQQGKGNYAYVQNADSALSAFGRELGGLLSTYAQDIKVFIDPQSGHQITKTLTDISTKSDPLGEVSFEIPEMLSEETRNIVFDTSISAQHKAFPRQFTIFNVKVVYSVLTERGERETKTLETKAKIRFVETGEEDKEIVPALKEVISLAQLIRGQLEAEEKANKGDLAGAQSILKAASLKIAGNGAKTASALAASMSARFADAHTYSSSAGYLRSVATAGTRSYGTVSLDAEAAQDLSFMQTSNSSMSAYADNFTLNEEPAVPIVQPPVQPTVNSGVLDPNVLARIWQNRQDIQATTHASTPGENLTWVAAATPDTKD